MNRTGRVPCAVQLQALSLIWERMDGKPGDKGTAPGGSDEKHPLMTVEEFWAAVLRAPSAESHL